MFKMLLPNLVHKASHLDCLHKIAFSIYDSLQRTWLCLFWHWAIHTTVCIGAGILSQVIE